VVDFLGGTLVKARIKVMVAVILCGCSFTFDLFRPAQGIGDGGSTLRAKASNIVVAAEEPSYAYVGSFRCKKCHLNEYKSWEATRMAKSFDILKPGQHKEAKEKVKIDVGKDYTKDEKCLKCHTTGFQQTGGYTAPPGDDEKAVRKAEQLAGVGCESCHGPGSAYIEVFEEILKSKRKYKAEELYAIGLTKVSEATCKTCHNQEGPTYDPATPFDYEKRKHDGVHAIQPLKQREE